jgi:hypothetical protein
MPKGFKHTKKTKEKISKSLKGRRFPGRNNRKKGYIVSAETRSKISLSNKGKIRSDEYIKKVSGGNSHFWKGGKTSVLRALRGNSKYLRWREEIFKRDNYCCKECSIRDRLEIHHIKKLFKLLKENKITTLAEALNCEEVFSTDNGITLCKKCHTEKHTFRL